MLENGTKKGRWTVLNRAETIRGNARWNCRCDCGVERAVLQFALLSGGSLSCGCARLEVISSHGECAGGRSSSEYKIWQGLWDRCTKPSHKQFVDYGQRGIAVCDRWRKFETFIADMGRRPSVSHSIERNDNDAGYTPENCRWATKREQARNRRSSRRLAFRDEVRTMAEWAEVAGLPYKIVKDRMGRGWSVKAALETPYTPRRRPVT